MDAAWTAMLCRCGVPSLKNKKVAVTTTKDGERYACIYLKFKTALGMNFVGAKFDLGSSMHKTVKHLNRNFQGLLI